MKLTPGKLAGLKKVSNERGVIAAAAMDQRGSLKKSLGKEKGGEVSDAMMEEFKSLVTEVLTPHASAILLDPEWGLPASKRRAKNAGLLLAYEKTGYDKTGPGRLGDLLDHWSATPSERSRRRLREDSALLHARSIPRTSTTRSTPGWSASATSAAPTTFPYFLEFVGYEEGADEKGLEYAKKKPRDRHREHARVQQGPLRRRRAQGGSAGEHEVRGRHQIVRRAEGLHQERSHRPVPRRPRRSPPSRSFIFRPASAMPSSPRRWNWPAESGVKFNGVLCGRATWKDGIPIYAKQGADAFRKWLETEGVKNINNVNDKLKAATSWHSIYGVELVHA